MLCSLVRACNPAAPAAREFYCVDHLRRLVKFEARSPYRAGRKVLCKDVHGPGCTACKTCHFCRCGHMRAVPMQQQLQQLPRQQFMHSSRQC